MSVPGLFCHEPRCRWSGPRRNTASSARRDLLTHFERVHCVSDEPVSPGPSVTSLPRPASPRTGQATKPQQREQQ